MSMKDSNGTIGNRSRDLPVYSTVPQPAVPPGDRTVNTQIVLKQLKQGVFVLFNALCMHPVKRMDMCMLWGGSVQQGAYKLH
jgi:hypothetical protein